MVALPMPLADGNIPTWSMESWMVFIGAAGALLIWAIRSGFWLSSIKSLVMEMREDVRTFNTKLEDHIKDDRRDFDKVLAGIEERTKATQQIAIRQENHEGRIVNLEGRRPR